MLTNIRTVDFETVLSDKMGTRHKHDHHDRQQKNHHISKTVTPCTEHTRHFLFMRGFGGTAGIVADPAGAVQNRSEKRNHQCKDIEIAQLGNS